jgi:hypothetical protein
VREPYYGWAQDAVETLDWLVCLDGYAFAGDRSRLCGRDPRVIDVAHVRWALASAVTALDLCAVELAYRYGDFEFWSEHAPTLEQVHSNLRGDDPKVAARVEKWFADVIADPDYGTVRSARNPLTHRLIVRSAIISIRPPRDHEDRSRFAVDPDGPASERPDARELIVMARDLAARHVASFGRLFGARSTPSPPRPEDR